MTSTLGMREFRKVVDAVQQCVLPCFGPRSSDAMIVTPDNQAIITSDAQRVVQALQVRHPVAKLLQDSMQGQFKAMGDGCSAVCILVCAMVQAAAEGDEPLRPTAVQWLLDEYLPNQLLPQMLDVSHSMELTVDLHQDAPTASWIAGKNRTLWDALEQRFDASVESTRDDAAKHKLRGNNLFKMKQYEEAVDAYLDSIATLAAADHAGEAPESNELMATCWNNASACLLALQRPRDAFVAAWEAMQMQKALGKPNVKALYRVARSMHTLCTEEHAEDTQAMQYMLACCQAWCKDAQTLERDNRSVQALLADLAHTASASSSSSKSTSSNEEDSPRHQHLSLLRHLLRSNLAGKFAENVCGFLVDIMSDAIGRTVDKSHGSLSLAQCLTPLERDEAVVLVPGAPLDRSQVLEGWLCERPVLSKHMPTQLHNARMALFTCRLELEWTSGIDEGDSVRMELNSTSSSSSSSSSAAAASSYTKLVDYQHKRLDRIVAILRARGVRCVLTTQAIGDYARQLCVQHGILACQFVPDEDMDALCVQLGSTCISRVDTLTHLYTVPLAAASRVQQLRLHDRLFLHIQAHPSHRVPAARFQPHLDAYQHHVTLLLRAPNLASGDPYRAASRRCFRQIGAWLRHPIDQRYVCLMPGGGAAEARMAVVVEQDAHACVVNGDLDHAAALRLLSHALQHYILQLYRCVAHSRAAGDKRTRPLNVLTALLDAHRQGESDMALVVAPLVIHGVPMGLVHSIDHALTFNVLDSLSCKMNALDAALTLFLCLLRLDGVYACKRLSNTHVTTTSQHDNE